MEYKKSRWENEYDNFKANDTEIIEQLKYRMDDIRREMAGLKDGPEYAQKKKELKEMQEAVNINEAISRNSDKIENILSFKKSIVERTGTLIAQKNDLSVAKTSIAKYEKDMAYLDNERKKLVDAVKYLDSRLEEPNLTADRREKLEKQKQINLGNIQKNDIKFSEIASQRDKASAKMKTYDPAKLKALNDEILKNEQLIGKCDLIGASLMKGKSMNEISAKLENFKFTPNKDFSKKIQAMREIYGKETESKSKEEKTKETKTNTIADKVAKALGREKESGIKLPAVSSDFDKKHPRLAKIKDFFKNGYNTAKEKISKLIHKNKDEKEETEKATETENINKEADFEYAMKQFDGKNDNEMLKNIVEKGTTGFRDSIKIDKKKKLEEMRKAKAKEYADKFGGRYAEQDGQGEKDEGR